MSVSSANIVAIVTAMETAFPSRVVALKWDNKEHSIQALLTESPATDDSGDLSGVIDGLRGALRIITSRCGTWTPPATGEQIWIDEVEYTVLGHTDLDTDATVRKLSFGEDSA